MTKSNSIALITSDLSIGYNDVHVLQQLNLELRCGELVCLMGQNGTGKSTLLRTISGIQKSISGQIAIGDFPLAKMDLNAVAEKISLVLTEKPSAGNLSVFDIISMGRYPYLNWMVKLSPNDRVIIDEAVEDVKLSHLLDKKLYTLSDGQLQKVMIARALVQQGEIMILDEPTSHLDLNNRLEIMSLLQTLAKKNNKAILIATHELDLALQMADRLWLIDNNRTIQDGIPEDLVLNGCLDSIFGHKGFDLKTGRVKYAPSEQIIKLVGTDYEYLWTKNAIERNGFSLSEDSKIEVTVTKMDEKFQWTLKSEDKPPKTVASIAELLELLS